MFPGSILSDSTALAALFSAALTKKKRQAVARGWALGSPVDGFSNRWIEQTKAIDLRKAGGSTPMRCLADPIRGGP